jgi:hypothetical protein
MGSNEGYSSLHTRTQASMGLIQRTRMAKKVALSCLALAGGMSQSSPCTSQGLHNDIPTNAHFSAGEPGWACNDGFRQVGQLCVLDTHGALDRGAFEVFSGEWRCRPGYRRTQGFCAPPVPPAPPANATLVGPGDRWECDWGFQKVGARCNEVTPPAHGYLEASGHDWVCYPGFERISGSCVRTPNTAPPAQEEPTPHNGPTSNDRP